MPAELERAFRLIAFDWDGTAVETRTSDASNVVGLLDQLLSEGVRIAIITGTSFDNVIAQLGSGIGIGQRRRLFVCTNRGSEVFGFDRHGRRIDLARRQATAEEEQKLDQVADGVKTRLERLTGLPFAVVRNRLNRRKIDLIPEPAYRDPPKSAMGALLAATEGRLRGAGLRGGLREVFELTERCAAEVGLAEARVTSDVKHIEVGLTDKGDSMRYVFDRIARPLHIRASDVLVLGDEFGPIAGFEGSDHKLLTGPEMGRAVVVSVGPEPGGAPEAILHLGGGPERFAAVLEHQIDLSAELGMFATPRDAAWVIEEPGFDLAREHEIESLLAIANGYVGSRGSIAEGTSVSRPATLLAGAFELSADPARVPELLVLPDWGRLRLVIEGEPFSIETGRVSEHRRVLDLRRGLLLREGRESSPTGRVTSFRTIHVASLANRHVLIEALRVTPENYTGEIAVEAILSGEVRSESGAAHWETIHTSFDTHGLSLVGRTRRGLVAALSSHLEVLAGPKARLRREAGSSWAKERCELSVRIAEHRELVRTVAVASSRDAENPHEAAEALRNELSCEPPSWLLSRHEAAWAERWRRANVEIDGAPRVERALRFAIYHLLAAANPEDPRCSIGARSLSGQAYRGHVFWDTEIFMLPFYAHAYPEAGRSLLMYRSLTLRSAKQKAKALGYEGALYAWESAETGEETTPKVILSPLGELVRVLSGEQEHHISADVAYAVQAYVRTSGDEEFVEGPGFDVLVETARFWASRVEAGPDGLLHIRRVIGPDEYHEEIDDNAFTNWMARFNIVGAADIATKHPRAAARSGVTQAEVDRWREVVARMYLGLSAGDGIIEQFAGYFALEDIEIDARDTRHVPIDIVLGRERTQASKIVKQADVIELIALLWDELSPEMRLANFLYYEPRTAHGSSLSPGIHALVAARLGLLATAERYLEQTCEIDLGNTMGNAAGGVHIAALGSLWQAVVLGVAGVRPDPTDDDGILIEPHLLPGWRDLSFPILWRGRTLSVHVEADGVEVGLEGNACLPIRVANAEGTSTIRAEPGRTYRAPCPRETFGAWEVIS